MIRGLWTAATGMQAQQQNIDVIANNLANVNTTGFKKFRADFEDLLYQTLKQPGGQDATGAETPSGIQIGHGVSAGSITKQFSQGSLNETSANPLNMDMALQGEGFFQVAMPDGSMAYTRDGSFEINSSGEVVTSDGYALEPAVTVPTGESVTQVNVLGDGTVNIYTTDPVTPAATFQLQTANFVNPAGLMSIGNNLMVESQASGAAFTGTPGTTGFGSIKHHFLERSNVEMVEEMVQMITSQRAYEINAKVIQTGDDMLGQVSQLKR